MDDFTAHGRYMHAMTAAVSGPLADMGPGAAAHLRQTISHAAMLGELPRLHPTLEHLRPALEAAMARAGSFGDVPDTPAALFE